MIKKSEHTVAVILAGGHSRRMGEYGSKILCNICSVPLIVRTMLTFEQSEHIDEILVVSNEEECGEVKRLGLSADISKLKEVIVGGETRMQSAKKGLQRIPYDRGLVVIHDGARPLVSVAAIERVILTAREKGAAVLAIPAVDTVKIGNPDGTVLLTPSRDLLFYAQTPQVFDIKLYRTAMSAFGGGGGADITDDASLIESAGESVYLVTGEYENIKITTPADIAVATVILKERERTQREIAAEAAANETV